MSDGIWENSSSMEKVWRGLSIGSQDGYLTIKVTIQSNLFGYEDAKVREYFANKIKQIVKIYIDDHHKGEWSRSSNESCDYLNYFNDVQIRDAYQVYDLLKGRIVKNPTPQPIPISEIHVGDYVEREGHVKAIESIWFDGAEFYLVKYGTAIIPKVYTKGAQFRVIHANK